MPGKLSNKQWSDSEIETLKNLYPSTSVNDLMEKLGRSASSIKSMVVILKLRKKNNTKSLIGEEWRDVIGYEGFYQVSNLGRVKALERKQYRKNGKYNGIFPEKILSATIAQRTGYKMVHLYCGNNKRKAETVHRLVAMAFLPNPDNLPCINHKDETRTNNNVDNLEWCTYAYNNSYGTARIRSVATKKSDPNRFERAKASAKKFQKRVNKYSRSGELLATYTSITEASQTNNVAICTVSAQCVGRNKYSRASNCYYRFAD